MRKSLRNALAILLMTAVAPLPLAAQRRITSPDGHAATEIRGRYIGATDPIYVDGKWIEISYGRPIKRGRDLWGSGSSYGHRLNNGAPVWRAGADVSTYLMSDVPLVINGTTVPAGGHTLFVDLKEGHWTFIVSDWEPQTKFNPGDKTRLWGSFGYTSDKDVVRAPMKLTTLPYSVDQLTWIFLDMSDAGGTIALMWDRMMATVPFTVP
jgi:Protein of unknown function (DUF2911)